MSNVYVHFSQISFSVRYLVINFQLESHSLRFREIIILHIYYTFKLPHQRVNFNIFSSIYIINIQKVPRPFGRRPYLYTGSFFPILIHLIHPENQPHGCKDKQNNAHRKYSHDDIALLCINLHFFTGKMSGFCTAN